MNSNEAVAEMHAELDGVFVHMIKVVTEFKPPCKAGCCFCCSEATFTTGQEVDHILDGMGEIERRELTGRVNEWLARACALLDLPFESGPGVEGIGIKWRRANLPCPLLKDGKCSVYEKRPSGCRSFFAMANPQNCEMPMRIQQQFVGFPHPHAIDVPFHNFLEKVGKMDLDHLGVHLANRLLGRNIRSACYKSVEVN